MEFWRENAGMVSKAWEVGRPRSYMLNRGAVERDRLMFFLGGEVIPLYHLQSLRVYHRKSIDVHVVGRREA